MVTPLIWWKGKLWPPVGWEKNDDPPPTKILTSHANKYWPVPKQSKITHVKILVGGAEKLKKNPCGSQNCLFPAPINGTVLGSFIATGCNANSYGMVNHKRHSNIRNMGSKHQHCNDLLVNKRSIFMNKCCRSYILLVLIHSCLGNAHENEKKTEEYKMRVHHDPPAFHPNMSNCGLNVLNHRFISSNLCPSLIFHCFSNLHFNSETLYCKEFNMIWLNFQI